MRFVHRILLTAVREAAGVARNRQLRMAMHDEAALT